jgi:hypothetical protein
MMYLLYQETEKTRWKPALASERDTIAKTRKPALVSVLDVDNSFDSDLTREETLSLRYRGPFYVDFDAPDIDEATTQFKLFLVNLQAKGVNLDMLRLFATGKKGYHIEVPAQIFMGKVAENGTLNLPSIYREMAYSLYVETLDMNVYSSNRGRMWRCPNVKRTDNGQYKVQISAEEAMAMDPELYEQLCSSPRNSLPIEAPTLNPDLGLLYAQSRDKVDKAIVKRKSKKHVDSPLLKFKGGWPETFEGILAGATIKESVGWNLISMQLAITASELGISEEKLLADAEGVINCHESDSSRYNTPLKRKRDLQSMFRYVSGNPCYEFSIGAVLALLLPEVRANADITFGEYVPDAPVKVAPKQTSASADNTPGPDEPEQQEEPVEQTGALRVSKAGIFVRSDEGFRNICDVGLTGPIGMFGVDGDQIGYELQVTLDGKDRGRKFLPMSALATRGQFNGWTLTMGASMRGTDMHTSALADTFRKGSKNNNVYAVEREGIDVVTRRGGSPDVIWASPDKVVCLTSDTQYRFHGKHTDGGSFNTDLMFADDLTTDDEAFVVNLLQINTDTNLAKLLGWFSAAFLNQLIRKQFKRFPSMQVFGQAGAGKSMTVILLNHLHYWQREPRQFSATGQTMYPLISAAATSASVPFVIEEVKARQMSKYAKDFLQNLLRGNYTGDSYQRGSVNRDKSGGGITVSDYANTAPVAFIGEAIEDQSAILERCLIVAMSKSDRQGRSESFEYCLSNAPTMGKIGRQMALAALTMDVADLTDNLKANFKAVSGQVPQAIVDASSRPAFNLAVAITGLQFMGKTLGNIFGNLFDSRIAEIQEAVMGHVMDSIPKNMAEASRVLDTMAALTRNTDQHLQMVEGIDYLVNRDGTLELKVRSAYDKYVRYQRSLGMEVLFDTFTSFMTSLANYGGTIQRACPGSILHDSPRAIVYKLKLSYLDDEGIDSFESSGT